MKVLPRGIPLRVWWPALTLLAAPTLLLAAAAVGAPARPPLPSARQLATSARGEASRPAPPPVTGFT
ncbi:MAG: hypothetical protein E6K80_06830 [Candidatus Eisenbacteria bacterium]|uniref:Uncharacterized protein n=1 Tax=Eiseniibacteriota bacterium TaxID=2212470 RepID=A0A538U535_UNCEI|nr:MAG: hypothetical protein E6K80_06830 [Candidatus Eisenbacteria bacterium]